MTRKQFRKEFAEAVTQLCRDIQKLREKTGDKSRLEFQFGAVTLVFPRIR